jgi:protein FAM50
MKAKQEDIVKAREVKMAQKQAEKEREQERQLEAKREEKRRQKQQVALYIFKFVPFLNTNLIF